MALIYFKLLKETVEIKLVFFEHGAKRTIYQLARGGILVWLTKINWNRYNLTQTQIIL